MPIYAKLPFHAKGRGERIDSADTEYILDTFPVLRDKEIREHEEYRPRRLVLERDDALAAAIASGTPYASPIDIAELTGDTRAAAPDAAAPDRKRPQPRRRA